MLYRKMVERGVFARLLASLSPALATFSVHDFKISAFFVPVQSHSFSARCHDKTSVTLFGAQSLLDAVAL